jgi:hypothetical protein
VSAQGAEVSKGEQRGEPSGGAQSPIWEARSGKISVTTAILQGVTTALRGAGYYPPLISLIRSKSSSLCPNACSHSKAQHLL